jgi:hypothetical protein
MKLAIGNVLDGYEESEATDAKFVADDGRDMFSVSIGKDGRSLEVRALNCCKVDGVLYSTQILVIPQVSNSVRIEAARYDVQR